MFWNANPQVASQIDTILDKPNVSLKEVLEQADVIQEGKSQNKKLIDFLSQNEVLSQLLDIILKEPEDDDDEKSRYKLPNIASELITCDLFQINKTLVSEPVLLEKLCSFLDTNDTLNPLLTSFFSKTFGVLITRSPNQNLYSYQLTCLQVVTHIKSRPGFIDLLLRHIHTSAVMDLLLRLITCVEDKDVKENILTWLNNEKLIERTIDLFRVQNKPDISAVQNEQSSSDAPEDSSSSPSTEVQQEQSQASPAEEKSEEETGMESAESTTEGASEETSPGEEIGTEATNEAVEAAAKEELETKAAKSPATISISDEELERDRHDNAGQLLAEIVRASRDAAIAAQPSERCQNALLDKAESTETVEMLLDVMLSSPPRESVIINCISALLSLIEIRKPGHSLHGPYSTLQDDDSSSPDVDRQQKVLERTVNTILPRLGEVANLLENPPTKPAVLTTAGLLDPPFGPTRLWICKLVTCMLWSKLDSVNKALANTPYLTILLDLFEKYSLNNFLHLQVEACVRGILTWRSKAATSGESTPPAQPQQNDDSVLQTPTVVAEEEGVAAGLEEAAAAAAAEEDEAAGTVDSNPLMVRLMTDGRLLERLVAAWQMEDLTNIGYMGHVRRISNCIVSVLDGEKDPDNVDKGDDSSDESNKLLLTQLMEKQSPEITEQWNTIVAGKLKDENKRNEISPIGDDRNDSSDQDSDYRDIQFTQDTHLQQMYSDYHTQPMHENVIDVFGLSADDYHDVEDIASSPGSESENKTDGQEDDEEDPWEDRTKEIKFGGGEGTAKDKCDEEHSSDDEAMDVDFIGNQGWPEGGGVPVAMDTTPSPWGEPPNATSSEGPIEEQQPDLAGAASDNAVGWASFESAGNDTGGWADFSGAGEGGPSFEGVTAGGGDIGFANFTAFNESSTASIESWNPDMASSPEATMLDSPSRRLAEDGDEAQDSGSPELSKPADVPSGEVQDSDNMEQEEEQGQQGGDKQE